MSHAPHVNDLLAIPGEPFFFYARIDAVALDFPFVTCLVYLLLYKYDMHRYTFVSACMPA